MKSGSVSEQLGDASIGARAVVRQGWSLIFSARRSPAREVLVTAGKDSGIAANLLPFWPDMDTRFLHRVRALTKPAPAAVVPVV